MPAFKKTLGLAVCLLFLLSFAQLSLGQPLAAPYNDWQVENTGGCSISQSGDVVRLSSSGGGHEPFWNYPSIGLYKEFTPTDDFTFSIQVKADTLGASCIMVRRYFPIFYNQDGLTLEFGHYGQGDFNTARNCSGWQYNTIASGTTDAWYTLNMTITRSPYNIITAVYDESGTCLGSYKTSDSDFKFDDIKYIAFGIWGYGSCDYSFRNVQDPASKNAASISLSVDSSTKIGSIVNVYGRLQDANTNLPLHNKTVVLSYTFPGLNSWVPVSSTQTNQDGEYSIQWINSASGTFTIKTEWSGDSTYRGASKNATMCFLPLQNQQTFAFESNSTVSALAFDNQTSTLSFTVTGPSNTTGYVRATIAKSLLADGGSLEVCIDGKQLDYTSTSVGDSWVYCFNYRHSTHQISMRIVDSAVSQPVGNMIILVAIVAVFCALLGVLVYSFSHKSKPETPN